MILHPEVQTASVMAPASKVGGKGAKICCFYHFYVEIIKFVIFGMQTEGGGGRFFFFFFILRMFSCPPEAPPLKSVKIKVTRTSPLM